MSNVKRPRTSFVLFCNDHRQQCKLDNPHLKTSEIFKELASLWSKYKIERPDIVEKYRQLCNTDIARYAQEKKDTTINSKEDTTENTKENTESDSNNHLEPQDESDPAENTAESTSNSMNIPKINRIDSEGDDITQKSLKPLSPYELFYRDELNKLESQGIKKKKKDVTIETRQKWKELDVNNDPIIAYYKALSKKQKLNIKKDKKDTSPISSQIKDIKDIPFTEQHTLKELKQDETEPNLNSVTFIRQDNVEDIFNNFEDFSRKYRPAYRRKHPETDPKQLTRELYKFFKHKDIPL